MKKRSGSAEVDGAKVRHLCARKGWGATELAKAAGLSPRKCQQMMAGERARLSTIKMVADALDVGPDDLIKDQGTLYQFAAPEPAEGVMLNLALPDRDPETVQRFLGALQWLSEDINARTNELQAFLSLSPTIDAEELVRRRQLEREREEARFAATKKIDVYFIPAFDPDRQEKMYFYVIASISLHDEVVSSLKGGDIPEFAVVVAKGYGEPSAEIKAYIKECYGFDHDREIERGEGHFMVGDD